MRTKVFAWQPLSTDGRRQHTHQMIQIFEIV